MDGQLKLYSYWRSSAAYRVRIALNLKGRDYAIEPVHLVRDGGQQHSDDYAALNPQELVPALRHGERVLTQSLAILEYLDEIWPEPALLPDDSAGRARVRALAQLVACDIHPLNNLRVMQFFDREWNVPQAERDLWTLHWMRTGFQALEDMLVGSQDTGRFCHGDSRAWPTAVWCRSCTTPAGSIWIWRRIRPWSGSSRPVWGCRRLTVPARRTSPTRRDCRGRPGPASSNVKSPASAGLFRGRPSGFRSRG